MSTKTPTEKVEALQATAAEIHRVFTPHWNARTDVFKTIISVSSGAIVLSVTFSSATRSLVGELYWGRLVFVSFILLTLALVLAFAGLWFGSRLFEIEGAVYKTKVEFLGLLEAKASPQQLKEALNKLIDDELNPIKQYDERADRCFGVSSICFCIAMALLALAGGRQMLY